MDFLNFLMGNPVVTFMALLVLLITVVPAGAALYRRYRPGPPPDQEKQTPPVRFLGTQMDIAILIFGALLLVALIIRWVR